MGGFEGRVGLVAYRIPSVGWCWNNLSLVSLPASSLHALDFFPEASFPYLTKFSISVLISQVVNLRHKFEPSSFPWHGG